MKECCKPPCTGMRIFCLSQSRCCTFHFMPTCIVHLQMVTLRAKCWLKPPPQYFKKCNLFQSTWCYRSSIYLSERVISWHFMWQILGLRCPVFCRSIPWHNLNMCFQQVSFHLLSLHIIDWDYFKPIWYFCRFLNHFNNTWFVVFNLRVKFVIWVFYYPLLVSVMFF